MTANELRFRHLSACPKSHFFDSKTLKFFGERMSDMYVLKGTVKINDCSGNEHECIVLSSRQLKYPSGPKRIYHYFDACTYEQVIT